MLVCWSELTGGGPSSSTTHEAPSPVESTQEYQEQVRTQIVVTSVNHYSTERTHAPS